MCVLFAQRTAVATLLPFWSGVTNPQLKSTQPQRIIATLPVPLHNEERGHGAIQCGYIVVHITPFLGHFSCLFHLLFIYL